MIIAATIAVNVVPKMLIDDAQNQGDTVNHANYYTTMQKIFTKVCDREIVISTLRDELKDISNEIGTEDYNSYDRIVLAETKEYAQFSSVNEESDSPNTAVDFVYHEPIQNVDIFILQSGEKAFQHFNGSLTNEFETLDEDGKYEYYNGIDYVAYSSRKRAVNAFILDLEEAPVKNTNTSKDDYEPDEN